MDNLTHMQFCPNNISLWNAWINHGTSQCFMDTISSSVMAGFILLCGTVQLIIYRKHATEIDGYIPPPSKLYRFQSFLLILYPLLAIVRFILQGFVYDDHEVYGFMILSVCLTIFGYIFSLVLVIKERHFMLPSLPTRGHGLPLLLFWTLGFITQNLTFVNLKHADWWFNLST